MDKVLYFSGDIELKSVRVVPNKSFFAIGGKKNKHNAFDSFGRKVGIGSPDGIHSATMPVTRKIFYKSNPSLHKCDARCMSAIGHNCECSCGGKNHGAANG